MTEETEGPHESFRQRFEGGTSARQLSHTVRMVRDAMRPLRGGPVCSDYAELPWKQRALINEVGGLTAGILAGKITEGTPLLRDSIYALLNSIDESLASQQSADTKDYLEKVDDDIKPGDMGSVAFYLAYGRTPSKEEMQKASVFYKKFFEMAKTETSSDRKAHNEAMTAFCHALFASAEFLYVN